jgi:hypothetical protein
MLFEQDNWHTLLPQCSSDSGVKTADITCTKFVSLNGARNVGSRLCGAIRQ